MSRTLRTEIKQEAPFQSLSHEAFLNLVRTAALLEHSLEEGLKPYGVTATQYNVLRILRGAEPQGLCRHEVGDRMVTPVPDATRLLDRLEKAGYVKRHRDIGDRRFVTARITAEGLALLERMDRPMAELHERQFGHMPEEDLRNLSVLLERARETAL